MLALEPTTILALSSSVLLRSLPDQGWYFAFDVASGDHFRLNRTSYWILEAVGSGVRWTDLRAQFVSTFDVNPEEGEGDLLDVVCLFQQEKLVRRLRDEKEPA